MMKQFTIDVTLTRTILIDVPEDATEEQILEAAKNEIVEPLKALDIAKKALQQVRVNIPKLDLKDWTLKDVNYKEDVS